MQFLTDIVYCCFYAYEGVMSKIWMSHVAHMNESSHTYEWVTSDILMSRISHKDESCRPHVEESGHKYGWVQSHVRMRHVTHVWRRLIHVTWHDSLSWNLITTHDLTWDDLYEVTVYETIHSQDFTFHPRFEKLPSVCPRTCRFPDGSICQILIW